MKLKYEDFCEKVLGHLRKNRDWVILTDWIRDGEGEEDHSPATAGDLIESGGMIELEYESGPFYEFMTIGAESLYDIYLQDGWRAVTEAVDARTKARGGENRRGQMEDYTKWLDDEGRALYRELRQIRSSFAAKRQLPPYFICVNRALFEMCREQPFTKEELREVYGIGEKSAEAYGEAFVSKILEFTGGRRRPMVLDHTHE